MILVIRLEASDAMGYLRSPSDDGDEKNKEAGSQSPAGG